MKKVLCSIIMLLMLVGTAFAKVNINSASVADLEALPGIGTSKAEAIVKYREENGSFKKVEDLMLVKGIGEKLYEKISSEVEVGK